MKTKHIIPLIHEDENVLSDLFNSSTSHYMMKPEWTYLPETNFEDDEAKLKYKFHNVKEGRYLTGLQIISDGWVNKGFCGMLLTQFGLVLDESNPASLQKDEYHKGKILVYLNFEHMIYAHTEYSLK